MFVVSAALGVACVAGLALGSRYLSGAVPEWTGQAVWLAVVIIGSAVCGFRSPDRAWRWGALIVLVQPPCLLLLLGVVGELTTSSSSTGGMVAVAMFTVLMLLLSPLAMLASQFGARRRTIQ